MSTSVKAPSGNKPTISVCRCGAYRFPHRKFSGRCSGRLSNGGAGTPVRVRSGIFVPIDQLEDWADHQRDMER